MIGAAPELRRCGVPRQAVPRGHDRYSTVVARGSIVSPCRLLQDQLVQRQIIDRAAKPRILVFKVFHPSRLIAGETGLGFNRNGDKEIGFGEGYVQLDVSQLLNKVSMISFGTNSTSDGETWGVYGSNSLGSLGSFLAYPLDAYTRYM